MENEVPRSGALTETTVRGLSWVGLSQVVAHGFQVGVTVILARMLTPEDFGIVAIANVVVGLAAMVAELGLGSAIVQRKNVDPVQLSTAFYFSVGLGFTLFIGMAWSAGPLSRFVNEPEAQWVIGGLSLSFVLGAFGLIHRSVLTRRMDFRRVAYADIGGTLGWGVMATLLAYRGWGVWSLVWGQILRVVSTTGLLWWVCDWRPGAMASWRRFRGFFSFGMRVTGGGLINYGSARVDHAVIGTYLGAGALGPYYIAIQWTMVPLEKIAMVITRVVFPAFSIVQDENERLRRGYAKVIRTISLLSFPLIAGLFVLAGDVVDVFLGAEWAGVAILLKVLCVAGALKAVGTVVGMVFLAKGRADISFWWNGCALVFISAAVGIGVRFGVAGVAGGIAISSVVLFLLSQAIANRLMDLKFQEVFRALGSAFWGACGMAIVVGGFRWLTRAYMSPEWMVVSAVVMGCASYASLIALLEKGLYREAIMTIRRSLRTADSRR